MKVTQHVTRIVTIELSAIEAAELLTYVNHSIMARETNEAPNIKILFDSARQTAYKIADEIKNTLDSEP